MADSPVFVDTGYLVAILNQRDRLHAEAAAIARMLERKERRVLTTDAVLVELGNFFAQSSLRALALRSIRRIRSSPGWSIERLTESLLVRAEARYGAHLDKTWSLTDCVSMEAMLDHGATEAATPDRHFAQAGFRVLMKASS